jgi:hypothetical protein
MAEQVQTEQLANANCLVFELGENAGVFDVKELLSSNLVAVILTNCSVLVFESTSAKFRREITHLKRQVDPQFDEA